MTNSFFCLAFIESGIELFKYTYKNMNNWYVTVKVIMHSLFFFTSTSSADHQDSEETAKEESYHHGQQQRRGAIVFVLT